MAATHNSFTKNIRLSALIIALGLLQVNVLPKLWPFFTRPDMLLTLALVISLRRRFPSLILFVLACGLFKDVFGVYSFGFNALVFIVDASLAVFASRYFYKEMPGFDFIIVGLFTLLNYSFLTIFLKRPYIIIGVKEALFNCMILPFITRIFITSEATPEGIG